jgi:serine/threonine protein phosphatase PrpC
MKYEFKVHTHKGIVREVNEDYMGHALNTPSGDIFVVCDGMGGHVGGKIASTIGVDAIINNLVQRPQSNIHVGISNALIFANEQVLGRTVMEPSLKGMGSTATVAVIKDELLYVGHVGDSRAYIVSNGRLHRVTRDDSYVQMLVDNNTITEDEAELHPQKNRILKALGSQNALEPNSAPRPFKMKAGDLLLLCSDGLCSMVVDEAIEQLIDPNDLQGSINQLHSMAMNNGGKDNITIILLKVTESPHSTSDFTHYTTKYQNNRANTQNIPRIENPSIDTQTGSKNNQKMLIGVIASLLVIIGVYFAFFNSDKEEKKTNEENKTAEKTEVKTDSVSKINNIEDKTTIKTEGIKTQQVTNNKQNKALQNNDTSKVNNKSRKNEAENLKNQYKQLCEQYKTLCLKKKNEKEPAEKEKITANLKITQEKLNKTWDEWSNTGLRQQKEECECN